MLYKAPPSRHVWKYLKKSDYRLSRVKTPPSETGTVTAETHLARIVIIFGLVVSREKNSAVAKDSLNTLHGVFMENKCIRFSMKQT